MSPAQQLAEIRKLALLLMTQARECLTNELLPQLKRAGIFFLDYLELNERQKASVDKFFEDVIFPVLTP